MKKLNLILTFLMIGSLVFGQNDQEIEKKPVHEIGIAFGFTTGYGLSYRYWPKKFGIQTTFLGYKTYFYQFNIGLTGLYKFREEKYISFFGYVSNCLSQYKSPTFDALKYENYNFYSVGVGPGISVGSKFVNFNMMIGCAMRYARIKFYGIRHEIFFHPTVETGFYYRF